MDVADTVIRSVENILNDVCRQMAVNNKFSSNMAESGNIYEFISGGQTASDGLN